MKIFLSYRRDDSAFAAQAIRERLARRFGLQSVFIDTDSIPPGVDFRKHIGSSITSCQLMIAVIGPTWLAPQQEGGTRLESPGDFVRIEIESAFRQGIPVLPVLVGVARMPNEDVLPEGLKPLAYRQAVQVRSTHDYQQDLDGVMRAIMSLVATPSETPIADPGEIHTNAAGIRELMVPAGAFLMGSPDSDPHAAADEKPQKRVRISKPMWMTITPITQRGFESIMAFNPSKYAGDPNRPVDTVSLGDAAEFCNALSLGEGLLPYYEIRGQHIAAAGGPGYRLPREEEWEYACRAGTTTRWSFGEDEADAGKHAWFADNTDDSTQAAGAKLPNPWGLHDMHGNVWELCWDILVDSTRTGIMPPAIDPPSECVLRGGCFADPLWGIRSAYRSSIRVAVRSSRVGFRVVRSVDS